MISLTGAARLQAQGVACEPVEIRVDDALPAVPWRAAIEELIRETRREGMPWSCAGGALSIHPADGGQRAILRLRDATGREVERHVPAARDLVPTAEALLSAPSSPPRDAPGEPGRPAERDAGAARATPLPRPEIAPVTPVVAVRRVPRLVVSALAGARYGGPLRALWLAPSLRVMVPIEAWSVGMWARYAVPHVFDTVATGFSMMEGALGISCGRRLIAAPVELRAVLDPSIVVIPMASDDNKGNQAAGAKIDFRVGLGLQVAIPLADAWRAVVALDGEVAPAGLGAARRIDPALPPVPSYGVGLAMGVEAVVW